MDLNSADFCKEIINSKNKGFGFVPFIGSGFSVPSGIPSGKEILEYLSYCIQYFVKKDGKWSPRKDRWPDLTKSSSKEESIEWGTEVLKNIKVNGKKKNHKVSSLILIEAIGALSNWRTALHFLSRLDTINSRPILTAPDPRITDDFFLKLTKDRQPNAVHIMLCHLSSPLRIRTIITTNFDTLIEDTFQDFDIPLVVFDVHHGTKLPDPSFVISQHSIIKMHGGRYGLRADFSLDEQPSDFDKKAFMGYLKQRIKFSLEDCRFKNHLFVIGTSGEDQRTISLIKYVLDRDIKKEKIVKDENYEILKVFWVCYTTGDKKQVERNLKEYIIKKRVIITVQRETSLFLFELYQRLTFSLPPAGGNYPSFWTVPPDPYNIMGRYKDNFKQNAKSIENDIQKAFQTENRKPIIRYNSRGISSVFSEVYNSLSENRCCIWLDLARFFDESHLFTMMTSALSQKAGIPLGVPISLINNEKDHYRSELEYYLGQLKEPVLMFLNGRDGPDFLGSETENVDQNDNWESEGWYRNKPIEAKPGLFFDFIRKLQHKNIVYIISCWKVVQLNKKYFDVKSLHGNSIKFDTKKVVKDLKEWIEDEPKKEQDRIKRFLFSMSLFRYAIHPAAYSSWGLIKAPRRSRIDGKDNDFERNANADKWLQVLREKHVIRDRPGGFVWIHVHIKNEILKLLKDEFESQRAECHEGIADWYAKLFRSSNDPCAAIESLRHRMFCLKNCKEPNQYSKICASLSESITTLKMSRNRILSCGYSRPFAIVIDNIISEVKEMQIDVADTALAQRIILLKYDLRITCHEILIDLYRELNEFNIELKEIDELTKTKAEIPGEHHGYNFELKQDYKKAIAQTGLRFYPTAENTFLQIIKNIVPLNQGLQSGGYVKLKKTLMSGTKIDTLRDLGQSWIIKFSLNQEEIKLIINSLRQYMFLKMLQAQLIDFNIDIVNKDILFDKKSPDFVKTYYNKCRQAEAIYALATELMRHVKDNIFLQTENTLIRTHYAVLLANMKRYYEARRRLNEASAYLSQMENDVDSISWAIIDIRLVEVLLIQARDIIIALQSNPEPDYLKVIALVNDAQIALNRAKRKMEGHRKNVWWWTWLFQLQIYICIIIINIRKDKPDNNYYCDNPKSGEDIGLICQSCKGKFYICKEMFKDSKRLINLDPLRQARLVQFALYLHGKNEIFKNTVLFQSRHLEKVFKNYNIVKKDFEIKNNEKIEKYVEDVLNSAEKLKNNEKGKV